MTPTMDYKAIVAFVQEHFTDGLVSVIGSGLSAAEGVPGMTALAAHLTRCADSLTGQDAMLWSQVNATLDMGVGLEATLLKHAPSASLEAWIARGTCALLLPKEREVMCAVLPTAIAHFA